MHFLSTSFVSFEVQATTHHLTSRGAPRRARAFWRARERGRSYPLGAEVVESGPHLPYRVPHWGLEGGGAGGDGKTVQPCTCSALVVQFLRFPSILPPQPQ